MVGAIALGVGIGGIVGKILNKWKADEYVDFTFSLGLAIGGYIVADHFLHVSGVVTTLYTAILIVYTHRERFRLVLENCFINTGTTSVSSQTVSCSSLLGFL